MAASPAPSTEERKRLFSLQEKLASEVVLEDRFFEDLVAGVDQAFISREDGGELVISGAVALDSSLRPVSKSWAVLETTFPYLPGLLSFREGPAALEAVKKLDTRPTLLFVDGCGINHPRRAGLASIIGVTLDIPHCRRQQERPLRHLRSARTGWGRLAPDLRRGTGRLRPILQKEVPSYRGGSGPPGLGQFGPGPRPAVSQRPQASRAVLRRPSACKSGEAPNFEQQNIYLITELMFTRDKLRRCTPQNQIACGHSALKCIGSGPFPHRRGPGSHRLSGRLCR